MSFRQIVRATAVFGMLIALMLQGGPAQAAAGTLAGSRVGYYDTGAGQGVSAQVTPITTAGGTATNITLPDAAQLGAVDVLFAQNPSNSGVGSEWTSSAAALTTWVQGGGVLIMHDRWVNSGIGLPGSAGITFTRGTSSPTSSDIEVNVNTTAVTNGPGGIVGNTTLDGGNHSSHGYVSASSLPSGAVTPLVRGDGEGIAFVSSVSSAAGGSAVRNPGVLAAVPNQAVTTCYRVGSGAVVYSTIPLDFYLGGSGSVAAFRTIYAPNVVRWGILGACGAPSSAIGCQLAALRNPSQAFTCNS